MNIIFGKNSVNEAIKAKTVVELYVLANSPYISVAKKKRLPYKVKRKEELDRLGNHQGVAAKVLDYKTYELKDIVKKERGLIVLLDGLEDPQNLGAIVRTADCAGVDGIIIRKDRSVRVTSTVAKVASGALEYVKIVEVTNLTDVLEKLKKEGYWIVGADGYADKDYLDLDYDMNTVVVTGSEGKGISRLVKKSCDFLVRIPMFGHVDSLNASVATAVMVYGVISKRTNKF